MKLAWCWRCKRDIPMLDEQEFSAIGPLYSGGLNADADFREQHGIPRDMQTQEARFRPLLDAYKRMTGFRETKPF